MDPTQNTSPHESAMPNVPQHQTDGASGQGMPAGGSNPVAAAAAVPVTPPPMTGGEAAWLPPTVPVQSSDDTSAKKNDSSHKDGEASSPTASAPHAADDGDVIEREWVDRAKAIVARTRQDPYNQAKELNKFKAEYLQKRYSKSIEIAPE